jgi:hypothetical protein
MGHISVGEANSWTDGSKLVFEELDTDLEAQQAAEVLSQISAAYPTAVTATWTDETNTPTLIRKIIAMLYTGWYYERTYSEDTDTSNYGMLLIAQAERLIEGLNSGAFVLADVPAATIESGNPLFYPTDASSATGMFPTFEDSSLGGPRFTMGTIW